MLILYNTNAPLYYLPYATVGMIVLNIFVMVIMFMVPPDQAEDFLKNWALTYGDGLKPVQWVTSNFVHGGIFHQLGNMFCLWGFGLVVEGQLGWWKFLLVYFGIGIIQCATEQIITLGFDEGMSLGASSIIFGLLAMAVVWAPKSEMSCALFLYLRPILFEAPILGIAGAVIVLQVLSGMITSLFTGESFGTAMTSEILHLMGAVVGFGLGVVLIKIQWVDCEGWDLFSVLSGRSQMSEEEIYDQTVKKEQQEQITQKQQQRVLTKEQINDFIKSGQPQMAYANHLRAAKTWSDWRLDEIELTGMIDAFHKQKMWSDSIPAMVEYLQLHDSRTDQTHLKLTSIL
ncbi:MAG: rhomboid family intramembrane serine protease, partial [Planctomycetes bacterium]|nr:rhomboid family intramembrane serine protease [Planctomycetota bacterium]